MRKQLFALLVLLIPLSLTAGGPWTPLKNHGVFIGSFTPITYTNVSNLNSLDAFLLNRRVTQLHLQLFAEYGITNNLAIQVNLPLQLAFSGGTTDTSSFATTLPTGTAAGISNSAIGFKYKLFDKKVTLAVSATAEFPATSFNESANIRIGFDGYSIVPGIHLGKGFSDRLYLQMEGSYAIRTNGYSDQVRANIEIGWKYKKPLWMAITLHTMQTMNNGSRMNNESDFQTGLYLNNEEYLAYMVKFWYELNDKLSVNWSFGGGATTTYIGRSPSLTVGMFYQW